MAPLHSTATFPTSLPGAITIEKHFRDNPFDQNSLDVNISTAWQTHRKSCHTFSLDHDSFFYVFHTCACCMQNKHLKKVFRVFVHNLPVSIDHKLLLYIAMTTCSLKKLPGGNPNSCHLKHTGSEKQFAHLMTPLPPFELTSAQHSHLHRSFE